MANQPDLANHQLLPAASNALDENDSFAGWVCFALCAYHVLDGKNRIAWDSPVVFSCFPFIRHRAGSTCGRNRRAFVLCPGPHPSPIRLWKIQRPSVPARPRRQRIRISNNFRRTSEFNQNTIAVPFECGIRDLFATAFGHSRQPWNQRRRTNRRIFCFFSCSRVVDGRCVAETLSHCQSHCHHFRNISWEGYRWNGVILS